MPHDEMIDTLQREVETLRERVRQLEDALTPSAGLPLEWGLTATEARLFSAIAGREMATKQYLMTALYSDRPDEEPEIKIVDVLVCKIRKKLRPFGVEIKTIWGQGYMLPDRERFR